MPDGGARLKTSRQGTQIGDMPNFPQSSWEPPEELEPSTTASALGQPDKVHTIFSQVAGDAKAKSHNVNHTGRRIPSPLFRRQ